MAMEEDDFLDMFAFTSGSSPAPAVTHEYYCPRCRVKMTEKTTKIGRIFYGCSRYPDCYFSCDIGSVAWRCATSHEIAHPQSVSLLQKLNNAERIHSVRKTKNIDPVSRRVNLDNPSPPGLTVRQFEALVKRVEVLEEENKTLKEFIEWYKERQKKIGFEIE